MIFVLFFVVLVLFAINLKVNKFDYVAPNSIAQIMALFMLSVLVMNHSLYDLNISFSTSILFFVALCGFCAWGAVVPCKLSDIRRIETLKLYEKKSIFFSFMFVALSTIMYFVEVKKIASMLGYSTGSAYGMLYYYRNATLFYPEIMAQQSKIVGQMTIASFAISYLVLIDFVKRLVFKARDAEKISFFVELLTVVFFVVQCILSGGRTQFLYYIESFFFLLIFMYQKKQGRHINHKILKNMIVLLLLAFVAFYFLGTFTGKTSIFDFRTTLFVYVGAPLPAFDKLVQGDVQFPQSYFGSNVFWGIFDIIRRLGFNIHVNDMTAPFVNISGVDSNIYGSFGRYYADFGILGVVIIPFVLGGVYQYLYRKLQKANKNLELKLVIYLILMQYVFDFCIEERFFLSCMSLGTFLRIAYMLIFYKFLKLRELKENKVVQGVQG